MNIREVHAYHAHHSLLLSRTIPNHTLPPHSLWNLVQYIFLTKGVLVNYLTCCDKDSSLIHLFVAKVPNMMQTRSVIVGPRPIATGHGQPTKHIGRAEAKVHLGIVYTLAGPRGLDVFLITFIWDH